MLADPADLQRAAAIQRAIRRRDAGVYGQQLPVRIDLFDATVEQRWELALELRIPFCRCAELPKRFVFLPLFQAGGTDDTDAI